MVSAPRGGPASQAASRERAMLSPEPGGTRGAAKDATEIVKAQAVILLYKQRVAGVPIMKVCSGLCVGFGQESPV